PYRAAPRWVSAAPPAGSGSSAGRRTCRDLPACTGNARPPAPARPPRPLCPAAPPWRRPPPRHGESDRASLPPHSVLRQTLLADAATRDNRQQPLPPQGALRGKPEVTRPMRGDPATDLTPASRTASMTPQQHNAVLAATLPTPVGAGDGPGLPAD